jgi:hypothetical protein
MVSTKDVIKDVIVYAMAFSTIIYIAGPTISLFSETMDDLVSFVLNIDNYLFRYEFNSVEIYLLQIIYVVSYGYVFFKFGIYILKTYPLEEIQALGYNSRIMINKTTKKYPHINSILSLLQKNPY